MINFRSCFFFTLLSLEVQLVYEEDVELHKEVKRAGGIKKVAQSLKWPPSRLSNKLNGWSPLFPDERKLILKSIRELTEIKPETVKH